MIKKIGIITILLLLIIGVKNVSFAAARPEVLILHSYSPDYEWTVSIQEGINSVLKPLEGQYNLRVEYMDTNHNPNLVYRQLLYSLYKEKYAKTQFNIILVADNAALDFMREYRDELFPSTPVVFCGINGYKDSMLVGFPLVTGVAETNDFLGAFTAAFTVYPKATEMIVWAG